MLARLRKMWRRSSNAASPVETSSPYTGYFNAQDMERLSALQKRGFAPKCIFDVGASNGWWSRLTATLFPGAAFHMFEPLAEVLADYGESLRAARAALPNLALHACALGEKVGQVSFFQTPDGFGSSALPFVVPELRNVSVPMRTVTSCIQELGVPVPQLIKIDTQGSELAILKGAASYLPQVEVLLLETWLVRSYGGATPLLHELCGWLAGHGFYLWDLAGCYRGADGSLVTQDCLFLNKRSALSQLCNEPIALAG